MDNRIYMLNLLYILEKDTLNKKEDILNYRISVVKGNKRYNNISFQTDYASPCLSKWNSLMFFRTLDNNITVWDLINKLKEDKDNPKYDDWFYYNNWYIYFSEYLFNSNDDFNKKMYSLEDISYWFEYWKWLIKYNIDDKNKVLVLTFLE